jgi:hypothetical protein
MDLHRDGQPADPARLDVDKPATLLREGLLGAAQMGDAFVVDETPTPIP